MSRRDGSVSGVWIVAALRDQARWCARLGSPLYAELLTRAAADAIAGGPVRDRLERLDGALALARRVPAPVDAASAEAWVPERLEGARDGTASVVYQTVVDEYLSEGARRGLRAALEDAGRRATPGRPLAWLRLEPRADREAFDLALRSWPGGDEVRLATCGGHGAKVRWL